MVIDPQYNYCGENRPSSIRSIAGLQAPEILPGALLKISSASWRTENTSQALRFRYCPIYPYRNYRIDWQIFTLHHGLIIKVLNPGFVWSVFIIFPLSWKNIIKHLCEIRSQLYRILLKGLSKSSASSKPKMALFSYAQVEISFEYRYVESSVLIIDT